ncbi:MAG TPA: hypothetical protein PK431_10350 [Chitinophagales bacterium]|nr:hypothetical protein [Chitinophagales bacterium]
MQNNIEHIDKRLFWDTDFSTLDFEKQSVAIIGRIISRGNFDDFQNLFKIYSYEKVKQDIQKVSYLSPKNLNFASTYFEIDKKAFKCYSKTQWSQQHGESWWI